MLQFNLQELARANGEFEIMMYLGGKTSPLIFSHYKFRIDLNNLSPTNVNDLIIERKENKYAFEYSDDLGMTEEQRINAILER
ncbi:MAG: hypothetical protein EPN37_10145 [Chitinophagaceae bacterium]|nr:MAG: hypothetical protein EPN37_10145 [Chitinophagaceae bacterium]